MNKMSESELNLSTGICDSEFTPPRRSDASELYLSMPDTELNKYINFGKQVVTTNVMLPSLKDVYVVMGNESCDLDSVVSSLIYGYALKSRNPEYEVLSVLNIPQNHFPIKTEVCYYLAECSVEIDSLIFRDEIDLKKLNDKGTLRLILVDHHTLKPEDEDLSSSVIEVIDHRPQDPAWMWLNRSINLHTVGSCSTLIAQNLMNDNTLISPMMAELLYGAIVLDTACFSKSAGIATKLDLEVAAKLEAIPETNLDKNSIFKDLQNAKANVSHLPVNLLLFKDMKIIGGIPIAALPILVKDILIKDPKEAGNQLKKFCVEVSAAVVVIMGLTITDDLFKRDIAVYSRSEPENVEKLVKVLKECKEPDFELQDLSIPGLCSDFHVFNMRNIKATRKHILPVVRSFAQKTYAQASRPT